MFSKGKQQCYHVVVFLLFFFEGGNLKKFQVEYLNTILIDEETYSSFSSNYNF